MKRTRLKPGKPLERRGSLPAASKRRRRVQPDRRKLVQDELKRRPRCEVAWDAGCEGRSVTLHEPKTRRRYPGDETILDRENTISTCGYCHTTIHDRFPAEAQRRRSHGLPSLPLLVASNH